MGKSEIQRILCLHHQAYNALMWMNREPNIRSRVLAATEITLLRHEQTCERWVTRHVAEMPKELQPGTDDLPAFARMLSSFFSTSFELQANGSLARRNARLPRRKAKEKSQHAVFALQRFALQNLAEQTNLDRAEQRAHAVSEDKEAAADRALWSYVWELRRRSQFASQGGAVHHMWLALDPESRKDLTIEQVWSARSRLLERLRAAENGI